jgi:hypothetical protein
MGKYRTFPSSIRQKQIFYHKSVIYCIFVWIFEIKLFWINFKVLILAVS